MGLFGKNIYNINYPSAMQQISRNKINIENLQKIIKQAYKTTEQLNEQSVSVALNTTNITDNTITSGWLISPNGLLFQIASVLEDLVYINYWANIKGETGAQGGQGPTGPQGIQGKRGFGFYTTQQQILSTGITEVEYGDIIGYDNPQIGDFVISENEQSNGYYGRITSLATLTTTIEYIGTLKGEKGINYTGTWVSGGEYYVDDIATYNGSTYICISNINGGTTNPSADTTHWDLFAQGGTSGLYMHSVCFGGSNISISGWNEPISLQISFNFISTNSSALTADDIMTRYAEFQNNQMFCGSAILSTSLRKQIITNGTVSFSGITLRGIELDENRVQIGNTYSFYTLTSTLFANMEFFRDNVKQI